MTGSGAVEPLRLSDEIYHFTENGIIPTDGQLVMLGIKAEDLEAQVAELREQIELDDEQHQKEITDISNKNGELQTKLWQIQETFGDLEKRAEAAEVQVKHLINERNQARRERDNALGCAEAEVKLASVESALAEARKILKEQCPDIEKCQDLPSDPSCDGCDRYVLWKAVLGVGDEPTRKEVKEAEP